MLQDVARELDRLALVGPGVEPMSPLASKSLACRHLRLLVHGHLARQLGAKLGRGRHKRLALRPRHLGVDELLVVLILCCRFELGKLARRRLVALARKVELVQRELPERDEEGRAHDLASIRRQDLAHGVDGTL